MGKNEVQHQQQSGYGVDESVHFCQRCSMGLINRIAREFNFRCVFIFILTLSILLSGIFWILPNHSIRYGFDVKDAIKLRASVQVSFKLQKPVSQLVLHVQRLEYDINEEIGVPDTKVAILSMHQASESNGTDVVSGFLSDPVGTPVNPVSLSILRSSLIDLFLRQSNLTLTTSVFGQPSIFEIKKFPQMITIFPLQSASIWQTPQISFNFTLYNSISEIQENFVEFEEQLKSGLDLTSYENVFVQLINKDGSTTSIPITVQASVVSDMGSLLPQRLRQLAETITGSAENLGLDDSVFGEVKSVRLSSYLKGVNSPIPSPAPSPEFNGYIEPSSSPSYSPAPSPQIHGHVHSTTPEPSITVHSPAPCPYHDSTVPPISLPIVSAPYPSILQSPPRGSTPQFSPSPSPTTSSSYGPGPGSGKRSSIVSVTLSPAPSQSSLGTVAFCRDVWLLGFAGTMVFHLLYWLH